MLAYSGLRPESEGLKLTWGNVGEHTLEVHATKTGRTRYARLLKPLADDLRAWRILSGESSPSSLLFPGPSGKAWTERGWQNWRRRVWRPAATAAGLPAGSRPRDLRASYASLLIRSGMTVVEVAHELGHSPAMCLRVYGRAFAEAPKRRVKPETAILNARKELARSLSVPTVGDD